MLDYPKHAGLVISQCLTVRDSAAGASPVDDEVGHLLIALDLKVLGRCGVFTEVEQVEMIVTVQPLGVVLVAIGRRLSLVRDSRPKRKGKTVSHDFTGQCRLLYRYCSQSRQHVCSGLYSCKYSCASRARRFADIDVRNSCSATSLRVRLCSSEATVVRQNAELLCKSMLCVAQRRPRMALRWGKYP